MLVLERIEIEFIVENLSVKDALEAMLVDDIVSDKFEVGVVDAEAIVGEELVVDVVQVGDAEVVGFVVEEDIKFGCKFGTFCSHSHVFNEEEQLNQEIGRLKKGSVDS